MVVSPFLNVKDVFIISIYYSKMNQREERFVIQVYNNFLVFI